MITLTHRAEQCLRVLLALDRRELLMAEAAQLLGRSVRQVRRLRAAFRARGVAALVHGNRGRPPGNRIADRNFHDLLPQREDLTLSRPSVQRILRAGSGTMVS